MYVFDLKVHPVNIHNVLKKKASKYEIANFVFSIMFSVLLLILVYLIKYKLNSACRINCFI